MEIKISHMDSGITILEPQEDIDLYNCIELKDAFITLRKSGKNRFLFDLRSIRYIDSSGIGVLAYIFTSTEQRNLMLRNVPLTWHSSF